VRFAAGKHQQQRRKDVEATPYINHPIAVAELLARVGGITDLPTLQAALLHDTIEDTSTTPEELDAAFGHEVRRIVQEVTDDKSLPKVERKRLQIEHASHASRHAKNIKLADKISNLTELTTNAPIDWSVERKREYVDWAEKVIAGIRGTNAALEELFDQTLAEKRRFFSS